MIENKAQTHGNTLFIPCGDWPASFSSDEADVGKAPVEPDDIMVIVITGVGVRAWLTPLEKVQLQ